MLAIELLEDIKNKEADRVVEVAKEKQKDEVDLEFLFAIKGETRVAG